MKKPFYLDVEGLFHIAIPFSTKRFSAYFLGMEPEDKCTPAYFTVWLKP